jgi:hypothetical protein
VTMFAQSGTAVVVPTTPRPTAPPASVLQSLTLSTEAIATLLDVAEATEERAQLRVEAAEQALEIAKRSLEVAQNDMDSAGGELAEANRNAALLRDQLSSMESGDTVTATFQ